MRRLVEGFQGSSYGGFIAIGFHLLNAFHLRLPYCGIVYFQDINLRAFRGLEDIHPHNLLFTTVNTGLLASRSLLNPKLGQTLFYRLGHTAQFFYFLHQCPGTLHQFAR